MIGIRSFHPSRSWRWPCSPSPINGQQRLISTVRLGLDKYERSASKHWNDFYKRHESKFFKDRHYLEKDWGCFFSDENENCKSEKGKVVLEAHGDFRADRVNAFVSDVTVDDLSKKISPSSVDVVTLIFTLSAVSPKKMPFILQNIRKVLKPNGYVLLRDYANGDFAQEKLTGKDRLISENFYVRGDGTCAFYFTEDFLTTLFEMDGFSTVELSMYCKKIENRSRKIVMDRRWIRAIFCSSHNLDPQPSFLPKST